MFIKFICTHFSGSNPRKLYLLKICSNTSFIQQRSYYGQRRRGLRLTLLQWLSNVRSRYCMWKLCRLLGPDFNKFDFLIGARQAAISIIEAVRQADWNRLHSCCTNQGACAIYNLCQSQRNLHYLKLLRFESKHLCQVSPKQVARHSENGRTYIYVNLAFVGLRHMKDFTTVDEQQEILQLSRQVLEQSQIPELHLAIQQRIVLSEFLLTLRRDSESDEWLVDFYKVFGFKLVNYSPVTLEYRVIEILKPV